MRVPIHIRPEDVRALEDSARSVVREDFTTRAPREACMQAATRAFAALGHDASVLDGSMLVTATRSGLQRVALRGTFHVREGSCDVALVGSVGEVVPLMTSAGVLGVIAAVSTFYASFAARLPPALAAIALVVVGCVVGVAWAKWRSHAANASSKALRDAFRGLRAELERAS